MRSISRSAARQAARDVADPRRQADRGKMRAHARGVVGAKELAPRREAEGERHADRHRLAVQQPVGEAGLGLERVAEGVAEIEQRALAGLALVVGDDAGLGLGSRRRRRGSRAGVARRARRRQFASSQAKKAASPIRPYLTTSA